ncbi:MAG: prephenate dehydrogenase/arogenate dehydrogenase family protein [bacterium]|nr:prephenate dehydrogenase/arogenate dehydrogenase family protein [bacterium]
MSPRYDIVTIIGAGLLGASLGLALKARNAVGIVRAVGHRQSTLNTAKTRGAVDETYLDPAEACTGADLVVICAPAAPIPGIMDQIRPVCSPNATVTDVASTKGTICAHARDTWPKPLRFVGSHPMAGSEKFGPEHADASLYEDSFTIMEPRRDCHAPDAWDTVSELWRSVGSSVIEIEPELHDALVARTSHLPHVAAACLAEVAASQGDIRPVVGNGFRDVTRIAAGRTEVWRDICLTNPEAIVGGLDEFIERLQAVRDAIHRQDAEALSEFFESAQHARRKAVEE